MKLETAKYGVLTVTCVMLASASYRFNPDQPVLRIRDETLIGYGAILNNTRIFQHRFVAGSVQSFDEGQPVLDLELDDLRGMTRADLQALTPPAEAASTDTGPVALPNKPDVTPALANRELVPIFSSKVSPSYPAMAKKKGAQGTVRILATIEKDGRAWDMEVIHDPDPLLSAAALAAVKQWKYQPYLRDGQPQEVKIFVNVIFRLGGPPA